ncbi:MAG: MarR family transcriptional regulator [Puniceicoccaceae bacterium]|nr:MAG: MarR family transcriptional regulator [Puniceicoccaceae bacterium]
MPAAVSRPLSTQAGFPDRHTTLGAALRHAYDALSEHTYAELAAAGFADIRPAHRVVFRHLAPEGSRIIDLARAGDLTKQSMAYLIAGLEESGYVALESDPEDGRAKRVRLTPRGEAAMEILLKTSRAVERRLDRRLGAGTSSTLKQTLGSVAALLQPPAPAGD